MLKDEMLHLECVNQSQTKLKKNHLLFDDDVLFDDNLHFHSDLLFDDNILRF